MTLYKLTTAGLGDFWVVATDPSEAVSILDGELRRADYGMDSHRQVTNIAVITHAIPRDLENGKLIFSSGYRLIVQEGER